MPGALWWTVLLSASNGLALKETLSRGVGGDGEWGVEGGRGRRGRGEECNVVGGGGCRRRDSELVSAGTLGSAVPTGPDSLHVRNDCRLK